MSIFLFIVILFILVLVHELGHFFVAKLFDIRTDEFGIGYPPRAAKLFRWKDTDFTLNWLPFGGFVKIFGEDPTEENMSGPDSSRSFVNKPKYQQALVLVAGVVMNFILGWMLLSIGYLSGLPTAVGTEPKGATISSPELMITGLQSGKPAEKAGFKPGDKIKKVTTTTGELENVTVDGLREFVASRGGEELTFTVKRVVNEETIKVVPEAGIVEGQKAGIGIALDMVGTLELPWYRAPIVGLQAAFLMTKNIVYTFGHMIGDAFTGKGDISQITGPVGIVGVVGDAYKIGFVYLMSLAALISLNLAVINLVPFPALDGGRLLFVIIEAIIRRPIPAKFANILNMAGFFILIGLMLFITYHDVVKLIK